MVNVKSMKKSRDIDGLIRALNHPNKSTRRDAANKLGKIGDASAVKPLIKTLNDGDYFVRGYAARALGKIGDPKAVDSLIRALDDSNMFVRFDVVRALGKIGDPRAVDALSKLVNDINKVRIRDEKTNRQVVTTVGDIAREALKNIKSSLPYIQKKFKEAKNYELAFRYEEAIKLYQELNMVDDVRRIKLIMAKNQMDAIDYEKAAKLYEEAGHWKDAGRVRKFAQSETKKKTKALERKQQTGKLTESDKTEIKTLHEKLVSMVKEERDKSTITEINKLIEAITKLQSKVVVKGDYMEGGKTDISGIVQRSTIDEGEKKPKPFTICPYCGEELNLLKTPKYCPYCREQLR